MKTNKHLWLFGLTVFALAISAGSTMAQPDPYWAETSDTQTLPLNAEGTIACFVDFIKTKKDDWGQAIQACKAK